MNNNCLLAFTKVMTRDRMRQSYHSVLLQRFIADTISTETGTTDTVYFIYYKLEYFYLFQAWTWRLTMLQMYVTLWGRWCVCASLLKTWITFSTYQNPFDKHIAYFSQND